MKTNKLWSIFTMLMIALCTSISVSSCGSDDDDKAANVDGALLGTWVWDDSHGDYTSIRRWTFNNNGTFTVYMLEKYKDRTDMEETTSGTYRTEDGYLIATAYGETVKFAYSINGNKLTLVDLDDPSETMVLTKQ